MHRLQGPCLVAVDSSLLLLMIAALSKNLRNGVVCLYIFYEFHLEVITKITIMSIIGCSNCMYFEMVSQKEGQ